MIWLIIVGAFCLGFVVGALVTFVALAWLASNDKEEAFWRRDYPFD